MSCIENKLSVEQLNKLPTHRLLNLYKTKRKGNFDHDYDDVGSEAEAQSLRNWDREWSAYLKEMKDILDTRENIFKKEGL